MCLLIGIVGAFYFRARSNTWYYVSLALAGIALFLLAYTSLQSKDN